MKKIYSAPTMEEIALYTPVLLAGSGVSSDELDILFGGVDVEGIVEPAAPELDLTPDLSPYFD